MTTHYRVMFVIGEGETRHAIAGLPEFHGNRFSLEFVSNTPEFVSKLNKYEFHSLILDWDLFKEDPSKLDVLIPGFPKGVNLIFLARNKNDFKVLKTSHTVLKIPEQIQRIPETILGKSKRNHSPPVFPGLKRKPKTNNWNTVYENIFKSTTQAVLVCQPSGEILRTNKSATQMLGYTGQELARMSLVDIFTILDKNKCHNWLNTFSQDKNKECETIARKKDGRLADVKLQVKPMIHNGEQKIILYMDDITGNLREKRILEREKHSWQILADIGIEFNRQGNFQDNITYFFNKVLSHFPFQAAMLWRINPDTNRLNIAYYRNLNDTQLEFFDRPETVIHMEKLYNETDKVTFLQRDQDPFIFSGVTNDPDIQSMYFFPITQDNQMFGLIHFLSFFSTHLPDEQEDFFNRIVHQLGATLVNEMELENLADEANRYRESDVKYQTLVENAEDYISIIQDGKFVFVNKQIVESFEYREEEIIGRPFLDVVAPDERERVRKIHNRRLNGEDIPAYELKILTKTGKTILVEVKAGKIEYNGRPAFQFIARDVTLRKAIQRQLHQSEKLATLGQIISSIAHELNNPLTSTLGYAELLLNNARLRPKYQRYVENINHQLTRAKKIVENLLDFARQHPPEKTLVDPVKLLKDTIRLREYELQVNDIQLETNFDKYPVRILADPHQLQEVFLNILINAEQAIFAERNFGRIRISCHADKKSKLVTIMFENDGPPIPEDYKSQIFDPFFTSKPPGSGTGLGLSISAGFVKENGGAIFLNNESELGTCFTIQFPLSNTGVHTMDDETITVSSRMNLLNTKSRSILLIDDEPAILEILSEILEQHGLCVTTVESALYALEQLNLERFDLIICDIKMPGMNGQEFYEALQEINPELCTRIIFATGDIVGEKTRTFLQKTRNRFIAKPFRTEELLTLIQLYFIEKEEKNGE